MNPPPQFTSRSVSNADQQATDATANCATAATVPPPPVSQVQQRTQCSCFHDLKGCFSDLSHPPRQITSPNPFRSSFDRNCQAKTASSNPLRPRAGHTYNAHQQVRLPHDRLNTAVLLRLVRRQPAPKTISKALTKR